METPFRHRSPSRRPPHPVFFVLVAGLAALVASAGLEAQAELQGADRPPAPAALVGTILTAPGAAGEVGEAPVAGAEVWILGTGVGTLTDGDGRFRLAGLPAGRYRLLVGARGYRENVTAVDVTAGDTDTLRIALETVDAELERRAAALRAEAGARGRTGFRGYRERMSDGVGEYVSRVEIDAADTQRLSEVIRRYTNVEVRPCGERSVGTGVACYWVVTGTRYQRTSGVGNEGPSTASLLGPGVAGLLRAPSSPESAAGKACVADVFLDGVRMDQERHPNGIDAVSPSRVEAIEIYRRGALAPARFRSVGGCGVVILWSR